MTAIRTHLGTFEFLTMNFGPCSAPAQWTRLMEAVLRPFLAKFCIVYLDDLTIYSKTPEEHVIHLEKIYRLLAKNKIFLRFEKCIFFATKIEFLGWIVEDGKLGASTKKLELVSSWPIPDSKKAVRSFVGFANFYRRLISGYTVIMKPLTDLLKDDIPDAGQKFVDRWKPVHDEAVKRMKEALCSAPVVAIANPSLPYILEVDASEDAVGGILSQKHEDGVKHVIEYFSKRTGPAQERYFPYKLEMLALITCLTHWRHLLLGSKFPVDIHTDHLALESLGSTKNPSRLYLRWSQFINQFKFKVIHIPGVKNPADFLSRPNAKQVLPDNQPIDIAEDDSTDEVAPRLNYIEHFGSITDTLEDADKSVTQTFFALNDANSDTDILEEQNLLPETITSIREATAKDPYAQHVIDNFDKFPDFKYKQGLLWNKISLYIPASVPAIRDQIFDHCHGIPIAGHYGIDATQRKIRKFYFWPGMKEEIRKKIQKCVACAYRKRHDFLPRMLRPHAIPAECWDVIFMDQVTGLPISNGYDSIYVFVDKLSKMVHFVPTVKLGLTKEKLATYFFQHIFRLHGLPKMIVSDRTPLVNNAFWNTLFSLVGTRFNITTPNHPQTDSSAEAHVQICTGLLRQFVNGRQDDWYDLLPAVEFAHNSTPNITGYSPYEVVYNRTPRTPACLLYEEACKEFVAKHTTATTQQAMGGGKHC